MNPHRAFAGLLPASVLLALAGCGRQDAPPAPAREFGRVDNARIEAADSEPGNWYTTGRTFAEERFSPLTAINTGTVDRLGFTWQYDLDTTRGLEATPVIVDGVMYFSGIWSRVYALDAATGAPLWTYAPVVDGQRARDACCDLVSRGIAVWQGKVYLATIDGFLIALDAGTGKPLWKQDTFIDRARAYTITGAPRIAGGKVVIGNGGGEIGVRGYVSAYDARTGAFAWRFFIVPGNPKLPFEHPELAEAARTWDPDSRWETGLGGTAWDSMAYDAKLNLLYVGTGNSNPYPLKLRSPNGGDNLYLCSILAIDPDTGKLVWHYQTTPGEEWDYTSVQHMILADLEVGGRTRQLLMQAPKNGFFYVLDRATGELLSAEKYVPVNWATHVDMKTGKPVRSPEGDYSKQPRVVSPSSYGGHNWHPMAYSPQTRLVYIPTIISSQYYEVQKNYPGYIPGYMNNVGVGYDLYDESKLNIPGDAAALKAWDPVAQKEVWRIDYQYTYNGGLLATAGNLVVQGTVDGYLRIYSADTGKLLKEIFTGSSIMAAPASYAVNGEQYITVLAGYGGANLRNFPDTSAAARYGNAGRVLTFKLGGGAVPIPPEKDWHAVNPPLPERMKVSKAVLKRGEKLFSEQCSVCHADEDKAGGYPNLLRLTPEKHRIFDEIVLRGAFAARGMSSFADFISEDDAHAMHAFIIERTHAVRGAKPR